MKVTESRLTITRRRKRAREKPAVNAFIQKTSVIISDLREQARFYRGWFA